MCYNNYLFTKLATANCNKRLVFTKVSPCLSILPGVIYHARIPSHTSAITDAAKSSKLVTCLFIVFVFVCMFLISYKNFKLSINK